MQRRRGEKEKRGRKGKRRGGVGNHLEYQWASYDAISSSLPPLWFSSTFICMEIEEKDRVERISITITNDNGNNGTNSNNDNDIDSNSDN